MSKVNDFLSEAGTFFLATVDGDQPKVRPLGLHFEMDGKVLFGIGDFKNVYRQLVKNPNTEIVACKP
ncbi:MAG: pyridoxamine 5'-phosphate oxidase family protein, partial [Eubacterium sp.]|nr:pyridoxamine 5'-phosphate oxidase family protein [Eubacterium sp.]